MRLDSKIAKASIYIQNSESCCGVRHEVKMNSSILATQSSKGFLGRNTKSSQSSRIPEHQSRVWNSAVFSADPATGSTLQHLLSARGACWRRSHMVTLHLGGLGLAINSFILRSFRTHNGPGNPTTVYSWEGTPNEKLQSQILRTHNFFQFPEYASTLVSVPIQEYESVKLF